MLQKTSAYVKRYAGETKFMYFFIKDEELIEVYKSVSNRESNSTKKELNCEHSYRKKFLKTKIGSYSHEAKDFHDKEVLKVGSNHACLAIILIVFILQKDENYSPIL